MEVIWTIRSQLEARYQLETWCPACKRHLPPLDLRKLVERGHGEQNAHELDLRHRACGTRLEFIVRPPSKHTPLS